MRWKRGSGASLLPCAWLLLLLLPALTLAAALSGGDEPPPAEAARAGRRLDEDEESRILWRGWLLVDEAPSRRKAHITPKSVFIAPVIRGEGTRGGMIPACAEGYRSDAMGRCHKVVRVNQAAHLDFLLQRLNALYREPSSSPATQGDAAEKGPLLVTIPLATNPPDEDEEESQEEVDLVVVVEASVPKDAPGAGRLGLLPGADEAQSAGNATGSGEQSGEEMETAQAQAELSIDPIIPVAATNRTEEGAVRREVSGSVNETAAPPTTSTTTAEEEEEGEGIPGDDGGHIYETTFIADLATTESSRATESPPPQAPPHSHHQSLEVVAADNRSEEESQKRIVFPGRAEERVRFPDEGTTGAPPERASSRPWGAWNRPMLLKFWTQMPLVREPTRGPDGDSPPEQGDGWASPAVHGDPPPSRGHGESPPSRVRQGGGPYQRRPWIYYQEMSPRDLASVSRVFDRVRHFESHG